MTNVNTGSGTTGSDSDDSDDGSDESGPIYEEVVAVVDPTQGASEATENALRTYPATAPFTITSDIYDRAREGNENQDYSILYGTEGQDWQDAYNDVQESAPDPSQYDPFQDARNTLGTLANVALVGTIAVFVLAFIYVIGQIVTFNVNDE